MFTYNTGSNLKVCDLSHIFSYVEYKKHSIEIKNDQKNKSRTGLQN